jgi:pimeloyl-ACP methyl ester carboxylesterase
MAAVATRAALLLLGLAVASLAGCRGTAAPITWEAAPAPAVRGDVVDGRGRFREILCAVREVRATGPDVRSCESLLARFPGEPPGPGEAVATDRVPTRRRLLVVQGVFGECIAPWIQAYGDARPALEALGARTGLIRVSGTASSTDNARQVHDAVLALDLAAGEQVVLVGYSKGAVDAVEALVRFPALVPRVAALVSVAGPITGSPIADAIPGWQRSLIETALSPFCGGGRGGIASLARAVRRPFIAGAQLPASVRYFSLVAVAEGRDVSRALAGYYRDLARVDPHNDGQVLPEDAVLPGSVLLGYARADHWAVAQPFSRVGGPFGWLPRRFADRNAYPRELLLEAIARAVDERL